MIYAFEEYELDVPRYELRYAGRLVKLEPQFFNVLAYLLQHRDRVVTKEEPLAQQWPGRFVSEATLTSLLTAARRAIGDRGRAQRVIQTVHGRGYRFIVPVEERIARERASHNVPAALPRMVTPSRTLRVSRTVQAVGREAELAQLDHWLQQALSGTRQVVFVTGEAGLGKTTLVETFLHELDGAGALWIGHGQCIEHYGAGEAYLPMLEALGRLCQEPGGQELITLLARQAPTWVVQMPWLVTDAELEALQRRVMGATQERMLRETAEALAILAAERPLILVLEDLHWSDYSTVDLIPWLARQQEPARLLVLGTYRPPDVTTHSHPLQAAVHELKLHHCCQEVFLTWLTIAAVEEYLTGRFAGTALPNGLAHLHALYQNVVYQRITAARHIHLHRRIGASKVEAYGPRAGEIAAELAVHFEHGRDYGRAVQYLQQAAETAGRRHTPREAIEYLRRALALLKAMPETPQLIRQELELQVAIGPALMVTRGFAAPEVADTYARARQLCEQLGDRQLLFPVLFGLWRSSHVRAQLPTARELGEQLLHLASGQSGPALLVEAHGALGQTLCIQGELTLAREHLQQVVACYEPQQHTAMAFRFGYDPGVYARALEGWVLWMLGYPEQALRRGQDALTMAREQLHPFTLALTLATTAVLQQMRREGDATLEHVKASLALSTEHGFPDLGG